MIISVFKTNDKRRILILRNFKNNSIFQVLACKEMMYRTGHLDVILKHEDFSTLYIEEETQNVRGYCVIQRIKA